jgi:WD40 repeat protein
MSYIFSVGWDKKIHVWADEKEEEVETSRILPRDGHEGHRADIMSATYCLKNGMIYTGGHDGQIIAWNFETGYAKYKLHENDKTCVSDNIMEGKSVDQLVILEIRDKLMSMSCDQNLRFWHLNELTGGTQPSFKFHCKHPDDDGLSACQVTKDNDIIVTADTSGQLKMWDIKDVDLDDQSTATKFIEKYFIIAHRGATINSIQIVEEKNIKTDRFIITAATDNNIHLHRLSNGVFIGQFGQAHAWNIHDISAFEKRKPRYVREWYLRLKARMKELRAKAAELKGGEAGDPELQPVIPNLNADTTAATKKKNL